MTNLLHTYVADLIADRLTQRRVVVWFDPREEFSSFVQELGGDASDHGPRAVTIGDAATQLATYDGSLYSTRARVESLVAGEAPDSVLIYLPGVTRDPDGSVLMELELAGCRWEPQLKQLARNALRQKFTDGVVDDLLNRQSVSYQDLVDAVGGEGERKPSLLKALLQGRSADEQLAHWLATPSLDEEIKAKEAHLELQKLVRTRLGLELEGASLDTWRSAVSRYVLAVEFRADLDAEPPQELASIADASADVERNARAIAQSLRRDHADVYPELADRAAAELRLDATTIDALALGSVDTFRFEEAALLQRCGELVRAGEFDRVTEIATTRASSFWLHTAIDRRSQWQALLRIAELGAAAVDVANSLASPSAPASEWVTRYAEDWYRLDRAQRQLEALLPKLDEDPDEQAIAYVRQRYDDVLTSLSQGFVAALEAASWSSDGLLHQTSIYDEVVAPTAGRVAYFLVDAMRYEMGAELAERLDAHGEITIKPAVGVLPSITTTGMAALMPGAAASYEVTEIGGKLVARIDGSALSDRAARSSRIKALVPTSEDLTLADVLSLSKSKLKKKLEKADLVVVRSQEIDAIGEGGFHQARNVMNTVIEDLARAVRKLATVGIERAVIASDHGHLYPAADREEAMRIDAPGGAQVELHRRCWIGRGGATPPGCVRVPARVLGNDNDLDFVFPRGIGVFKSGGDLSFHHGGPSLQELVIPVITVRSSSTPRNQGTGAASLTVTGEPTTVTNRIFSVQIAMASLLGADQPIKPLLLSDQRTAGHVGLAIDGEHDPATDTVKIGPSGVVTVGFVLDDDDAPSVRIVIVDPATDAELYRSPQDIPVQLGVH